MKTNTAVWRLDFAVGLLVACLGYVATAAEPKAGDVIENSIKMKLSYYSTR